MKPEILFSAINDAPDHVERLRKIVVAMAITGQLGEVDDTESPEVLLEKISSAKSRLQAEGILPKKLKWHNLEDGALPEGFPDSSKFVSLGNIAHVEKGKTAITKAEAGEYPLVVTGADQRTCDHFDFEGPAAIVPLVSSTGHGHASINRLHYREGKFALGTILVAIFPHDPEIISARFLFEYLTSFKEVLLVSRMTGTANVTLTIGRVQEVPVPLVSSSIQRRLDDLMTLLDRLETTRAKRETTRDHLTIASLTSLTAPDTTKRDFPAHARFALDNLDQLTSHPEQIKGLQQTILNLAVRGKLVEQDPADEPASELLKQISADKKNRAVSARDRKAGEIKPLKGTITPFDLPPSWVCVAFGDITISRDGERVPVSKADRENRARIYDYYGASGVIDKIDDYLFDKPLLLIGEDGANLLNRSTPIAFIARGKYWVNNHAHVIDGLSEEYLRYLELFINTTDLKPFVTGTAQPKMNQAKMNSIPVALPPLAEQHRIVEEVDALMTLCSRLEGALENAEMRRAYLLENLLNKALSGDTGNSAEPPEVNFASEQFRESRIIGNREFSRH